MQKYEKKDYHDIPNFYTKKFTVPSIINKFFVAIAVASFFTAGLAYTIDKYSPENELMSVHREK